MNDVGFGGHLGVMDPTIGDAVSNAGKSETDATYSHLANMHD